MLIIRLALLLCGLFWWPLLIVWLILAIWPHVVKDRSYVGGPRTIHVYHHPWQPPVVEPLSWLDELH